jgi:hypothetical protein
MMVLKSEKPINYGIKIFSGIILGVLYNIDYLVITRPVITCWVLIIPGKALMFLAGASRRKNLITVRPEISI